MGKFLIEMRKAGTPLYYMGQGTMAGGMVNFCGDNNMASRFDSAATAEAKIDDLQAAEALKVAEEKQEPQIAQMNTDFFNQRKSV